MNFIGILAASAENKTELNQKDQEEQVITVNKKGASMQTKDSTSSGDSDIRQKQEAKAKRLYIRQKAFDKYSFQHSVEESTIQGSEDSQGCVMNRTDSEKLDEQKSNTPNTKILTNSISTNDPEVNICNIN